MILFSLLFFMDSPFEDIIYCIWEQKKILLSPFLIKWILHRSNYLQVLRHQACIHKTWSKNISLLLSFQILIWNFILIHLHRSHILHWLAKPLRKAFRVILQSGFYSDLDEVIIEKIISSTLSSHFLNFSTIYQLSHLGKLWSYPLLKDSWSFLKRWGNFLPRQKFLEYGPNIMV